jgi:hypothetical protein
VNQTGQHDGRARVIDIGCVPNSFQGGLERRDGRRAHVNNRVGLTRYRSRIDDLGNAVEQRPKVIGGHGTSAIQFDVRLDSDTLGGGVDIHREAANRTRLNESINSTFDGARRKADDITDVGVARARIVTELLDYSLVSCVHRTILGDFLRRAPLWR